MIELIKTDTFGDWFGGLRDMRAKARIDMHLIRLAQGNSGDAQPVGEGISELRIDYGPGYRVYYLRRGPVVVVLLCGGDKGTQARDIALAKELAAQWKE